MDRVNLYLLERENTYALIDHFGLMLMPLVRQTVLPNTAKIETNNKFLGEESDVV